jgi:hypothetical protein
MASLRCRIPPADGITVRQKSRALFQQHRSISAGPSHGTCGCFTPVTEVACEFNVRRRGPPHLYTKAAPVALGIFDHQRKTTFATVSSTKLPRRRFATEAVTGHDRPSAPQQKTPSLDHLVGSDEQASRYGQSDGFRSFKIENGLIRRRRLYRQVAGLGAA